MVNDFRQLGNVMTKVGNRTVDKSYEIYMALYQGLSGTGDPKNIYREFSPDFFDLIVVDECHRGSARVDSAWREILAYCGSAVQIGLTATPKETSDVSNIGYFGEPVHTYSLKQGIQDGFLAPYKVFRIRLDQDVTGYHVQPGKVDKNTTRLFYDPEFDGEPVQAVDYGPGEPLVLKDPADEPYITGPFPDANNGDETDDGGGRTQYRVEGETGCRC